MKENYFLNELRNGVSVETLSALLADAAKEYENEIKIAAYNKKLNMLAVAIQEFIGRDHECWEVLDVKDVAKSVAKVLEDVAAGNDLDCCTEHECDCAEDCSCEPKIAAKMIVHDKNGTHTKDLSPDEVDEILGNWLSTIL